jgi:hypothetical protein
MKIQWEEPAAFIRAVARSKGATLSRWQQVAIGVGAAIVVFLLTLGFEWFFFWLHKKDLGVPAYFYVVAPVISGIVAGFFPTMLGVIPATIILTDKGIHRNKPIGQHMDLRFWPWESVTGMAIENVEYAGEVHRVLVVKFRDQFEEVLLGLGKASVDEIRAAARQVGKDLVVNA